MCKHSIEWRKSLETINKANQFSELGTLSILANVIKQFVNFTGYLLNTAHNYIFIMLLPNNHIGTNIYLFNLTLFTTDIIVLGQFVVE